MSVVRRMVVFLFAAMVWAGSHSGLAQTLLVRPYLQPGPDVAADGLDSKIVNWITNEKPGQFRVEYGWSGSATQVAKVQATEITIKAPTAEQLKKKPKADATPENPTEDPVPAKSLLGEQAQHYVKYSATLTSLPRDQQVWYRVSGSDKAIGENWFKTRATTTKPVRFVAVGDLANGKAPQNQVAYQASLAKASFAVILGDVVYSQGRVSQYMEHFWSTYVNVEKPSPATGAPLLATMPFYVVPGNHDVDTSLNAFPDALGLYYFFQAPPNGPGNGPWNTPIGKDKEEVAHFKATVGNSYPALACYSFDEGAAHFLMLDNCGYVKFDNPAMLKWIEQDLNSSRAKWKFVCCHAPAFHSSPAHYTEQKMRLLMPLLEKCGVDVVWAGHVHNYQRSYPVRFDPVPPAKGEKLVSGKFTIDTNFDGMKKTKPNGVIHIVTGGGGGTLYKDPVEKTAANMKDKYGDNWAPYTAKHVTDRHSFTYCDVTPTSLFIRAIDQNGQEIDRVTVTKE